jgi:hypothetical protein
MDAVKDYELKIAYMKDHLGRMWQRFNYMLGIQTAIAGGKFILSPDKDGLELCMIGFLFAVLWYMLGAQDRYLFKLYQKQVQAAFVVIEDDDASKTKSHVGQVDDVVEKVDRDLFTWRFEAISSTKMAAIVPMVIAILWVVFIFFKK